MLSKEDLELKELFFNIKNRNDLANVLDIKLSTLTYLINDKRKNSLYKTFNISKRNHSNRTIDAPQKSLKTILKKINYILTLVYPPKPSVHGFINSKILDCDKRSIISNALQHVNKRFILNIDLENFFPSISRNRIAGLFRSKPFNFSKDIAKDLANICTYNNHLPQGAPTSPILSNMICRKMDNELQNLAKAFRCTYTRYADDITFSTMKKIFPPEIAFNDIEQDKIITKLGWILTNIILQNGFSVNVNKTRLQNYTTRQEVTGLVVNKKINIQRKYIKKIRAVLHNWEMNGIDNAVKKYNMHDKDKLSILNPERKARKFKQVIRGKIEFIGNVRGKNDFIYAKFFNQYNRLIKKSAKHIPENEIEQINEYLWMLYSEETFIQGTAFSIEDGRVITCAHCISNDTLAYKVNDPDQKYKIKILKKFDVNTGIDIAVLNILDEDNRIIIERGFKLGDVDNLKQFDEVLLAGYSNYSLDGDTSKLCHQEISAFKYIPCRYYSNSSQNLSETMVKRIMVPSSIMRGDSGGPLLNKKYEVIGIIAKGIDDSGQIKDDASYEIIPITAINIE